MAGSVIGALRVNLGLDSAQFERGTGKAQKSLASMRTQLMAVAGVAAALGAAITAAALRGSTEIDRLVKGGRRIDGTAGALRALELAASEAGVSVASLVNDIQVMNRELATGSAGATRALDRLGLSAQELAGMDADERVASIADRVRDLGLSSGEASGLLRDLGIRNREMVLLMMQGGDAIRAARNDVRDYGLEISEGLAGRIEIANDQMARLGVVTQYFGQRLAAEIVPALGAMAQAITDSMREGGLLRGVIDGLVDNLQLMASILAVATAAMGVRYVGALVLAKVATFSLTGALVLLRTALIRTGIGAVVVALGYAVDVMIRLRAATGSWGDALGMVADVAREVFDRLGMYAQGWQAALRSTVLNAQASFIGFNAAIAENIVGAVQAVASGVSSAINVAIEGIERLVNFAAAGVNRIIAGINSIPGMRQISEIGNTTLGRVDLTPELAGLRAFTENLRNMEGQTRASAEQIGALGRLIRSLSGQPLQSLQALRDMMASGEVSTSDLARATADLSTELEGLGGGGGGSAGRAASAIDDVTRATQDAARAQEQWASRMAGHFDGLITGGKDLRGVLMSIARQLESQAWQQLFSGIGGGATGGGGGFFGNLLGGLFGGFRASGGPVSGGTAYVVGERGPELFVPQGSGTIVPNGAMGGSSVVFNIDARGAVEGTAVQIAQALERFIPQVQQLAIASVQGEQARGAM